jgi:GAF domain-containing protein
VRGGTQIARHGKPGPSEDVPLLHGGERIGELVVGVRRGQGRLSRRDRAALEVLAAPLAAAVQATALTDELRRSQVQIIATGKSAGGCGTTCTTSWVRH